MGGQVKRQREKGKRVAEPRRVFTYFLLNFTFATVVAGCTRKG